MRTNNKAQTFRSFIALGVFIAVLILIFSVGSKKLKLEERTIGTTQQALLLLGQKADEALFYLDASARLAGQEASKDYNDAAGFADDAEEQDYPCGSFDYIAYWQNDQDCTPDFEEAIKQVFLAKFIPHLNDHPIYTYPTIFTLTLEPQGNKTLINATTDSLNLAFAGNGKDDIDILTLPPSASTSIYGTKDQRAINKEPFTPDYYAATQPLSLNYLSRTTDINYVVVHYTAGSTLAGAEQALEKAGLSYHYIIDKDGTVSQYVPEAGSAQHAGGCTHSLCLMDNMNSQSIGISFVNNGYRKKPGEGITCLDEPENVCDCKETTGCDCAKKTSFSCWEDYTEEQIKSFTALLADIAKRNDQLQENGKLKRSAIIMHSDIKPLIKYDPGPLYENQEETIYDEVDALMAQEDTVAEEQAVVEPAQATQEEEEATSTASALIGPANWCTGYEKSPTAATTAYYNRIQEEAWNSDGQTYSDIAITNGLAAGIDPALLVTHMIHESGMGKQNSCTASQKSALTGCGWPTTCAKDCSCTSSYTVSDDAQLQCTAAFDAIAYKEASTGQDSYGNGRYEECNAYADDAGKMWTCMLCIYQGNYDKDVTGQGKPYFTKDGTCTYAERFKDTYCTWRAYYQEQGYTVSQTTTKSSLFGLFEKEVTDPTSPFVNGGYVIKYDLPLATTTLLDIDIATSRNEAEFAKDLTTCTDDVEACAAKKLDEYNKTAKIKLNHSCTNNTVLETTIKGIDGCMQFDEDIPCSFTVTPTEDNQLFTLYRKDDGLYLRQEDGPEERFDKPVLAGDFLIAGAQAGEIAFTFGGAFSGPKIIVTADDDDVHKESFEETRFTVTRDDQGRFDITFDHRGETFPAYQSTYTYCEDKEDQAMQFAVKLTEQIPPAVTDAEGNYYPDQQAYELRWDAVTTYQDWNMIDGYTDTGDVADILSYEVYCSMTPFLGEGFLPSSAKTVTITRATADERFDPQAYAGQQMTIALKSCGIYPIVTGQPHIIIIAKDAASLYSFDYTEAAMETVEQPTLPDGTPLPITPYAKHGHYGEESRDPAAAVTTIFPIAPSLTIPLA